MRHHARFPDYEDLLDFHRELSRQEYSYTQIGATRGTYPTGFDHDLSQVYLGSGPDVFERARTALRRWQMFPPEWTRIFPANSPQEPQTNVVVLFHLFGLWWMNAARIIYRIEEQNRYGFAYGTLESHVEQGEEIFMVHRDEYDKVYYAITSFSRPRYWPARMAYPFARFQQRRFVRQSLARMQRLVRQQGAVSIAK